MIRGFFAAIFLVVGAALGVAALPDDAPPRVMWTMIAALCCMFIFGELVGEGVTEAGDD